MAATVQCTPFHGIIFIQRHVLQCVLFYTSLEVNTHDGEVFDAADTKVGFTFTWIILSRNKRSRATGPSNGGKQTLALVNDVAVHGHCTSKYASTRSAILSSSTLSTSMLNIERYG